ncbi:MAG: hypothetical protein J6S89_07865 [Paludibacteraceae bacterium]|nr:hypothetical protein [Paludibacteraceae bacterium]
MEKNKILRNVSSLTAEQLFEEEKQGNVTFKEVDETGELSPAKRRRWRELKEEEERLDDEVWEQAKYGNEEDLREYIRRFPNGKHVSEAKDAIDGIIIGRKNREADKEKLLEKIRSNPNSDETDIEEIKIKLRDGTISKSDLINRCAIPEYIVESIEEVEPISFDRFESGVKFSIPEGFTEVYFWGVPGSGKTCALAAVLKQADMMGYLNIGGGVGGDYAETLCNIYEDSGVSYLPPSTDQDYTQFLPFTLKKKDEKFPRSVALIELSGELFRCFYCKEKQIKFDKPELEDTFNHLNQLLASKNRKIHFFFVDYDVKNKKDKYHRTQKQYLKAAANYFQNPKNSRVFQEKTDAIYVILTKSDLMSKSYEDQLNKAGEYLHGTDFISFTNTLIGFCGNRINGGRLLYEPFTLGEVYFNKLCGFDGTAAGRIVDILMRRIVPQKKSIFDVLNR